MCRFTFYMGPRIRLSALLLEPAHSLIRQSSHARERDEPLNGDGFGVGWYAREHGPEPAVFRSITPAWNNRNLHNLARVVASDCILAHVRAATRSSGVNEANCHPFRYRQYLCMHNGDIGGFEQVRRRLLESVGDEAFANVYGSTDSEHFFAVFIDELLAQPDAPDPAARMAQALDRAIARVVDIVRCHGGGEPSYLNVAISDGSHAVVSRFVDPGPEHAQTLYYHVGSIYPQQPSRRAGEDGDARHAIVVSSERLTESDLWQEVPVNHMVQMTRGRPPAVRACTASAWQRDAVPA